MIVDGGLPSVPVGPADSEGPVPLVVGHPGTLHGPGNKASGVTDGIGTPPPCSQEGDQATGPHPARLGDATPALSSTGGGVSFHHPTPRLPRGYSTRFCVTGCNARGRVHINGECVVCRDFGGDR